MCRQVSSTDNTSPQYRKVCLLSPGIFGIAFALRDDGGFCDSVDILRLRRSKICCDAGKCCKLPKEMGVVGALKRAKPVERKGNQGQMWGGGKRGGEGGATHETHKQKQMGCLQMLQGSAEHY